MNGVWVITILVLVVGVMIYLASTISGVNDGMSDETMIALGACDVDECQASIDPKTGEIIPDPTCCGPDNLKDRK